VAESSNRYFLPLLLIIVAAVGFGLPEPARTDSQEKQLQEVRKRIERLELELNTAVGKRDSTRDDLQTQERRINELAKALRDTDNQLERHTRKLGELRRREQLERETQRRLYARA
jgi:septal ring factor EnvC (AmiA/AmiB activator)